MREAAERTETCLSHQANITSGKKQPCIYNRKSVISLVTLQSTKFVYMNVLPVSLVINELTR